MTWFSRRFQDTKLKIITVLLFLLVLLTEIKLKIMMTNNSNFHLSSTCLRTILSLIAYFQWRSSIRTTIGLTCWTKSRSQGWARLLPRWLTWSRLIIIWDPHLFLLHIHRTRINSINPHRLRWFRLVQGMKPSCLRGRHLTRIRCFIIHPLKEYSLIRRPLKDGRACSAVNLRPYYSPVSPHGSLLKWLIKMGFISICP